MPFATITDRVRQSPLGFALLNLLFENQRANELVAAAEHTPDGRHNAVVVPRAVGTIEYSGASYTVVAGSSPGIVSVSSSGTGVVTITLSDTYFASDRIAARITVVSNHWESVPLLAAYEVVSATSIKVYLTKLAALGGNSWAAVDASFMIAMHTLPVQPSATPMTFGTPRYRGQNLDATTWNAYVARQAAQRANFAVGHTTDGNGRHNILELPHGYLQAVVASGGTSYGAAEYENINATIVRASAGVLTINLDGPRWSRPLHAFLAPGYDVANGGSAADLFLMGLDDAALTASNSLEVRAFRYDSGANTWSRDDCDFGLTVHTGAA